MPAYPRGPESRLSRRHAAAHRRPGARRAGGLGAAPRGPPTSTPAGLRVHDHQPGTWTGSHARRRSRNGDLPRPPANGGSPVASKERQGESDVVGFWAEQESTPGDLVRSDPHEDLFTSADPRLEPRGSGQFEVLAPLRRVGTALHHHAPATGDVVTVDLHGNVLVDGQACQLRTLRGSEDQRPVLHDVVERKDLRLIGHTDGEPAEEVLPQELPRLLVGQVGEMRFGKLCHDVRMRRTGSTCKGTKVPAVDHEQSRSSPSATRRPGACPTPTRTATPRPYGAGPTSNPSSAHRP